MSATRDQRTFRWGLWHGLNDREGWNIVAYEHHCGAVTPTSDNDSDVADRSCSGCHFEIQHPITDCKPLYSPVDP